MFSHSVKIGIRKTWSWSNYENEWDRVTMEWMSAWKLPLLLHVDNYQKIWNTSVLCILVYRGKINLWLYFNKVQSQLREHFDKHCTYSLICANEVIDGSVRITRSKKIIWSIFSKNILQKKSQHFVNLHLCLIYRNIYIQKFSHILYVFVSLCEHSFEIWWF